GRHKHESVTGERRFVDSPTRALVSADGAHPAAFATEMASATSLAAGRPTGGEDHGRTTSRARPDRWEPGWEPNGGESRRPAGGTRHEPRIRRGPAPLGRYRASP